MRVAQLHISSAFKRFGSLAITGIGADVELVVMLGPNGSGKSSVFDAFLQWARNTGRPQRRGIPGVYFDADHPRNHSVTGGPEVTMHPSSLVQTTQPGRHLHVRTAHRNTPDVLADSLRKPQQLGQTSRFDRMVDTDIALSEHYQRLSSRFLPVLARLDGDPASDLELIRRQLDPLRHALARVLPHLWFKGLGDPTSEGSFYFNRDGVRDFRYENLSGGEKAVFDLLLDIHIAGMELVSPLICIDEPELHLNPNVQAAVLRELLCLLPAESQLWIATHSIGMIRQAFDLGSKEPDRVAFLNFGQVEGPAPDVMLEPVKPSRRLLQDALTVALDDLASLLAPAVLVVCEGNQDSDRVNAWDERIYRQIFQHFHQRVDFLSSGGKGELDEAARIAAVIAPGTQVLRLRDRDDLTETHRSRILGEDPNLRILKRRSLESYLVDDEVLEKLVEGRGDSTDNALQQLKTAREAATQPNGSAKGAIGKVFKTAKKVLKNAEGLGENKTQFSEVLARLIVPGMAVAEELTAILKLDDR